MANYTEAEIKAFKLKDKLMARLGALKAASINNEGLGKLANEIKAEAMIYYLWLYPNGKPVDIDEPVDASPMPNLHESKIVEKIAKELNIPNDDNLKNKILNWAKEVTGTAQYPARMESVGKFIVWYNERID